MSRCGALGLGGGGLGGILVAFCPPFGRVLASLSPFFGAFLLAFAPPAQAARPDNTLVGQLRDAMAVLASDDFAGREPGTEGEAKTLRYIARQWFDMGLVSGTNDAGHPWFAPVTVLAREPAASVAQFRRGGRLLPLPADEVLVLTSGRRSLIEGVPLLFVGAGRGPLPPRTELAGRVAVLLDRETPAAPNTTPTPAQGEDRQNALLAAGASAVLTVLNGANDPGGRGLASVVARRRRAGYALASEALGGDLEGFITARGFERLLAYAPQATPTTLATLEAEAARPGFTPRLLDLSASLEATTRETTIHTHNAIARLPGRHPEAGAVLLMAHWDHFGTCAQPPAEHLICNGAVDNASGVAAMLAIARRLAKGPPLDRDVYFLATTAEELGLLGAEAFAEAPPLPLARLVAAFNLDSVAIAPAGAASGVVGRGLTPLDAGIAEVARAQHLALVNADLPEDLLRRQDGWVLLHHDVPAVMVTSAYGDAARLQHYFDTDYHRPSDVMKPTIEYGGAAQDVVLNTALLRFFADMRKYPANQPAAGHGR